jgi:hypothetical protein
MSVVYHCFLTVNAVSQIHWPWDNIPYKYATSQKDRTKYIEFVNRVHSHSAYLKNRETSNTKHCHHYLLLLLPNMLTITGWSSQARYSQIWTICTQPKIKDESNWSWYWTAYMIVNIIKERLKLVLNCLHDCEYNQGKIGDVLWAVMMIFQHYLSSYHVNGH